MSYYDDVKQNLIAFSHRCAERDVTKIDLPVGDWDFIAWMGIPHCAVLRTKGEDSQDIWISQLNSPIRSATYRMSSLEGQCLEVPSLGGVASEKFAVACSNQRLITGYAQSVFEGADSWTPVEQSGAYCAMAECYPVVFSSAFSDDVDCVLCLDTSAPAAAELACELVGQGALLLCDGGQAVKRQMALTSSNSDEILYNPLVKPDSLTWNWNGTGTDGLLLDYAWDENFLDGVVNDVAAWDMAMDDIKAYTDLCLLIGWEPRLGDTHSIEEVQRFIDVLTYGQMDWAINFHAFANKDGEIPYNRVFNQDGRILPIERNSYHIDPPLPESPLGKVIRNAHDIMIIWKTLLGRMTLNFEIPRHKVERAEVLADAGKSLGIKSAIDAYFKGVNLEYIIGTEIKQ